MKLSFCVNLLLAAFLLAAAGTARAEYVFLPRGNLFTPILADPKEPRLSVNMVYTRYAPRDARGASVSAGGEIGILRDENHLSNPRWQFGVSGGVFGEFDLDSPSTDLVNMDYSIGFPITFRQGKASVRLRPYHQSSHMGDEYLARSLFQRVDFSYDSLETLFSIEEETVRLYAGGEYLAWRSPDTLKRQIAHGGIEARSPRPYSAGPLGSVWFITAADVKSWEEMKWSPAWSLKGGFEVIAHGRPGESKRSMSFLVLYYDGFTPYGQFYSERLKFWGFGVSFTL